MSRPERLTTLTFGVEFEFLVGTLRTYQEDPSPNLGQAIFPSDLIEDDLGQLYIRASGGWGDMDSLYTSVLYSHGFLAQAIVNALKAEGIPAHPWFRGRDSGNEDTVSKEDLNGWLVELDQSVVKDDDERSPTWDGEPKQDPYTYLGIEGIPNLYNKKCGLHVHVGDDANGFPIGVVRKLIAFFWAYEPGIEKLNPQWRRNLHGHDSQYRRPLRGIERLARLSEIEAIDEIWKPRDITAMYALLEEDNQYAGLKYQAVNIRNLSPPADDKSGKRTVEFRQFQGCLDSWKVVLWAKLLVAIMDRFTTTDENTVGASWMKKSMKQRLPGEPLQMFTPIGEICNGFGFEEGEREWSFTGGVPPDDGYDAGDENSWEDGWEIRRPWGAWFEMQRQWNGLNDGGDQSTDDENEEIWIDNTDDGMDETE